MQSYKPHYYLGLDLGQRADHSALAIIEVAEVEQPLDPVTFQRTRTRVALRHLHRLPLGAPYPAVAAYVRATLAKAPLAAHSTLVVDATGPGVPFLDFFTALPVGANLIKVLITASGTPSYSAGYYTVPRRTLLNNLAMLIQRRVLSIAPNLPETRNLVAELGALDIDSRSSAPHDDLAMATALAAWQAAKRVRSLVYAETLCARASL